MQSHCDKRNKIKGNEKKDALEKNKIELAFNCIAIKQIKVDE